MNAFLNKLFYTFHGDVDNSYAEMDIPNDHSACTHSRTRSSTRASTRASTRSGSRSRSRSRSAKARSSSRSRSRSRSAKARSGSRSRSRSRSAKARSSSRSRSRSRSVKEEPLPVCSYCDMNPCMCHSHVDDEVESGVGDYYLKVDDNGDAECYMVDSYTVNNNPRMRKCDFLVTKVNGEVATVAGGPATGKCASAVRNLKKYIKMPGGMGSCSSQGLTVNQVYEALSDVTCA